MKANGFGVLPRTQIEHYVARNWTFLAVRVAPSKNSGLLADHGRLPGLSMTFRSARAVLPLKLASTMGEFSVRAALFTHKPLQRAQLQGALDRGFEVVSGSSYWSGRKDRLVRLKSSVDAFHVRKAPASFRPWLVKRFGRNAQLHIVNLVHESINATESSAPRLTSKPALWPEDLQVPSGSP